MSTIKNFFAVSHALPEPNGSKRAVPLGEAHYSYKALRDKFCDLFDKTGQPWVDLRNPETYRASTLDRTAFKSVDPRELVHISFKPPLYLRPAGGFYNVACVAWEFDRFPSKYTRQPVLPNHDAVRMLSAFDETWVGCEYTRQVLSREGVRKVRCVPAPIHFPAAERDRSADDSFHVRELNIKCWPITSRNHAFLYARRTTELRAEYLAHLLEATHRRNGKTFLQIVNPHDRRKNLHKLIRSFSAFNEDRGNCLLLLKFTCPQRDQDVFEIFRWLLDESPLLDTRGVYFTTDFIPEDVKHRFIRSFDFYVSPSRAEGQNLPLQEAMALGVVPISTDNTAMADYINPANAFVIRSEESEVTSLTNADSSTWGLKWFETSEFEIMNQLRAAADAPSQVLEKKRRAARSMILEKYSQKTVFGLVNDALSTREQFQ